MTFNLNVKYLYKLSLVYVSLFIYVENFIWQNVAQDIFIFRMIKKIRSKRIQFGKFYFYFC